MFLEDSHEDEKSEFPNALDRPPAGRVKEPERKRLLRSVIADDAAEDATEAACRRLGRTGAVVVTGGARVCCLCCCSWSANDSVDCAALLRLLEAAAKR